MGNKRASEDIADELHGLVFKALIDEIKSYRDHVDEKGQPAPLAVPPALLAQALKALKDNGIDSPSAAKRLNDVLEGKLPNLEDVENEHGPTH